MSSTQTTKQTIRKPNSQRERESNTIKYTTQGKLKQNTKRSINLKNMKQKQKKKKIIKNLQNTNTIFSERNENKFYSFHHQEVKTIVSQSCQSTNGVYKG